MNFINTLFEGAEGSWSGGIAHILIIISFVIALGKILGNTKILGISLGMTWVLFVGIVFGHFNLTIDNNLLHFLKEFGLVLFVYSIGLQVGPGFFSSFKSGGLRLNILACIVILSGVASTIILYKLTITPATTLVGIMSGAVTNTPGLGAAQQAYFDSTGNSASEIALGYAVAYPLGVIGCIVAFIMIKKLIYRNDYSSDNLNETIVKPTDVEKTASDHPNLIPTFIGIALGCILGSIPVKFPGVPQAVKLGLAGGPLIVSILISYFSPKLKIDTSVTTSANLMIREIGIALFLACVGLEAGEKFVDCIMNGDGFKWIAYGALITVIPVLLGGVVGRYILKIDYATLIGVLSGSCTNPPALAYANEQDKGSGKSAIGYATVYPLAMFLRVLAAQLLILMMV